jgi:hypothetical protein
MNKLDEPRNLARVKLSVGVYSCDDFTPCFPEVFVDALEIPVSAIGESASTRKPPPSDPLPLSTIYGPRRWIRLM